MTANGNGRPGEQTGRPRRGHRKSTESLGIIFLAMASRRAFGDFVASARYGHHG